MKKKTLVIVFLSLLCITCKTNNNVKRFTIPSQINLITKSKEYSENWHFKDILLDSIPGISLNRAYDSIIKHNNSDKIIVAVIDNEIDLRHVNLKSKIWINKNEIPNNNIDDDYNGYVDDINGWNFIGNKKGEQNLYVNFEFTRILKKLEPYFKDKNIKTISTKDSVSYLLYEKVKLKYDNSLKRYIANKDNSDKLYDSYYEAKDKTSKFFNDKPYSIKALDSLKNIKADNIEGTHFQLLIDLMTYNIDENYINSEKRQANEKLEKLLGLDYNDRLIQGDNPDDISDTSYGNKIINNHVEFLNHGTKTAGVISNINQNDNISIMSLGISCYGDEHDKDIALAIRYAVDNGARVINMSFGKDFSLHKEWVFEAIQYADKHDVLIVSSAGNFNYNLNIYNDYYPNDNLNNEDEVSDNFLLVGATTIFLDKGFMLEDSNYGNIDVDVFAPGNMIHTTKPLDKRTDSFGGTSAASAVASGVAALIFSNYPDLTASEVKHILMDSGIEYNMGVSTPIKDDKNKTTPFNQLSKSGKVINAYNALIMADSISRRN
ncbi:S8 family serine peptidase [Winogradskyella sp. R77965]|uniref:S8 family serine peptidase n=1 Tax=Winogradskyella sp. R77965 TaxID=3093872 RepID=UPI0037DC8C9A